MFSSEFEARATEKQQLAQLRSPCVDCIHMLGTRDLHDTGPLGEALVFCGNINDYKRVPCGGKSCPNQTPASSLQAQGAIMAAAR